jgi:N-acetylmuramic acid 6-phosphate etherase
MTGGDYALIRSVESFEDYIEFGKRQARDLGISEGDTLFAITEGGETSSVISTALQAIDDGAKVFIAFNNPADLLCKHIERSKLIIEHSEATVLDLHCGPMALAGSTRLQAVTSELLVAGAALEEVARRIAEKKNVEIPGVAKEDPAKTFSKLLDDLESEKAIEAISKILEFEEGVYSEKGLVTYFADSSLLDIFTDTTERAPTFMLPPFVKCDDDASPQSWAFVKSPLMPTVDAWEHILQRKPRCLEWTKDDYIALGASEKILNAPPKLDKEELFKFRVGNESDPRRFSLGKSAAVALLSVSDAKGGLEDFIDKFNVAKKDFPQSAIVFIGGEIEDASWSVPCNIPDSPLMLWEHLAVKLAMNIVSTLTMARMRRIKSNWMSWVEATNKKLIDRSTRLIAELCEVSYEKACQTLFHSIEEITGKNWDNQEKPSPVQHAIDKIKNQ